MGIIFDTHEGEKKLRLSARKRPRRTKHCEVFKVLIFYLKKRKQHAHNTCFA